MIEHLLLAIIRFRMSRFKQPGDAGQKFYDGVMSAIGAELVRRTRMHGEFNPKVFAGEVARMQTQLEAVILFEDLDTRSGIHF